MRKPWRALFCAILSFALSLPVNGRAQGALVLDLPPSGPASLPAPGQMVNVSPSFAPALLKGMVVHPQEPFHFDFIVDAGQSGLNARSIKDESGRLIRYFLAALTIPENDVWVNLSPYERQRIIPEALGQTELGRDLLSQDYLLKQLTATMIDPQKSLGQEFWRRIYSQAAAKFGSTAVPVNTFNKVWILPDEAGVFERNNAVYVTRATLKVLTDADYLAAQKNVVVPAKAGTYSEDSQILREIVIPEITKEVNTGKNFAVLRQVYSSLILAKWYKETLKDSLLSKLYQDKNKIKGVDLADPSVKQKIYGQYLQAYKKGVFNYIKEEPGAGGRLIPRKYFSGGFNEGDLQIQRDPAMGPSVEGSKLFIIDGQMQRVDKASTSSGDQHRRFNAQADNLIIAAAITGHGGPLDFGERVPAIASALESAGLRPFFEALSRGGIQGEDLAKLERETVNNERTIAADLNKAYGAFSTALKDIVDFELRRYEEGAELTDVLVEDYIKSLEQIKTELEKALDAGIDIKVKNQVREIIRYINAVEISLGKVPESNQVNVSDSLRRQRDTLRDIKGVPASEKFSDRVTLVINRAPRLPLIDVDEDALARAIGRFIENAYNYLKDRPGLKQRIAINFEAKNGRVHIYIRNAAEGSEALERLLRRDGSGRQELYNFKNYLPDESTIKDAELLDQVRRLKALAAQAGEVDTREKFFFGGVGGPFSERVIKGLGGTLETLFKEGEFIHDISFPVARYAVVNFPEEAQAHDRASVAEFAKGGIDLNKIDVARDRQGKAIQFKVDSAQAARMLKEGVEGFTPVIINVTPLSSPLPLFGLSAASEEKLAKDQKVI